MGFTASTAHSMLARHSSISGTAGLRRQAETFELVDCPARSIANQASLLLIEDVVPHIENDSTLVPTPSGRSRKRGSTRLLSSGDGLIHILTSEMVNQETGRRARGRISAIHCLKAIGAAFAIGKVKLHQTTRHDVITYHRLGHVAPTNALFEKHMLCAQVGQTPRVISDNSKLMSLSERRPVGQDQLNVSSCCSGRM